MQSHTRSTIAVRAVVAALVTWFVITQVTDWPWQVMVVGVVVIAIGVARLGRWVG